MNDITLHITLALLLLQALYQTVRVRQLYHTVGCIHDSLHFFGEGFEELFENMIHVVETEDAAECLKENQAQIEAWDMGDSEE